ncbi:VanW family protein [Crassaminicella profunda]|uniref:VanW family protein n=1 Tax=Crassaminicella profunda TaxID=1286698 RepID=UPI001CA7AE9F|nr:VanW family protein [Crassaminicella profunda]QZY57377.1 VanW family protein [Crassaminicella profunda]
MDPKGKDQVKKSNASIGLIIVLLSFLIFTTAIGFFLLYRDTIYDGVMIENLDVGGLSTTEAQKKVQNHFDDLIVDGQIHFRYGDKVWHTNNSDIGYSFDYTSVVNEAYKIGREGNYFERLQEILSLYTAPYNISLAPIYDHKKIDGVIYNIQHDMNQPFKDATIFRKNGKFIITDEAIGQQLNVEKTKSLLEEELVKNKFENEMIIELPVETISPQITSESLSTIHDLIGEYTTIFNIRRKGRTQNLRLASNEINGVVLMPMEIFSFNKVVGPRSKERGYKDAPIIFKGEVVPGLGGGVCQVSSTLYNAMLLGNLEVVERYNHTLPSSYVVKGRDATVSYGVLDFKFKNILNTPIYIESYMKNNSLTVKIYGRKTDNKTVRVVCKQNEIVKRPLEIRYDPNLLEGKEKIDQKGRDGYKVTTYRLIYENGKLLEKQQISKDYYKPQKQIVVKGTKKLPISNMNNVEENHIEENTTEEIQIGEELNHMPQELEQNITEEIEHTEEIDSPPQNVD